MPLTWAVGELSSHSSVTVQAPPCGPGRRRRAISAPVVRMFSPDWAGDFDRRCRQAQVVPRNLLPAAAARDVPVGWRFGLSWRKKYSWQTCYGSDASRRRVPGCGYSPIGRGRKHLRACRPGTFSDSGARAPCAGASSPTNTGCSSTRPGTAL